MKVKLPRECTGQEILNALRQAATYEEPNQEQGSVAKIDEKVYEYEPGSVRQVLVAQGIIIFFWSWYIRKRFIVFGRILRDKIFHGSDLILPPLKLNQQYTEINFSMMESRGRLQAPKMVDANCNNLNYGYVKTQFEKILERFYAILAPAVTQ